MIKIGFIGAGKRTKEVNVPILLNMKDKYTIVGYVTKSQEPKEEIERLTGAKKYTSITSMSNDVDMFVISVPTSPDHSYIEEAISTKKPILIETPLSLDPNVAFELYKKVYMSGQKVGVIEQWPNLPLEMFKKEIINSGIMGSIIVVENDFRTYDYHGTSQLRSYLNKDAFIEDIDVKMTSSPSSFYLNYDNQMKEVYSDSWKIVTAKMSDNSLMVYKYSSNYKMQPFRFPKGLRICGTTGTIYGGCLLEEPCELRLLDSGTGETCTPDIVKEFENKEIKSISIEYGGIAIKWENPFFGSGFDEHQIGIAYHFDAMYKTLNNEGEILYNTQDFIIDLMTFYGHKLSQGQQ